MSDLGTKLKKRGYGQYFLDNSRAAALQNAINDFMKSIHPDEYRVELLNMTDLNDYLLKKKKLSKIRPGPKYNQVREYIQQKIRERIANSAGYQPLSDESSQLIGILAKMDTILNNIDNKNMIFQKDVFDNLRNKFEELKEKLPNLWDWYISYKFKYLVEDGRLIPSFYVILLLGEKKKILDGLRMITTKKPAKQQQTKMVFDFFSQQTGAPFDYVTQRMKLQTPKVQQQIPQKIDPKENFRENSAKMMQLLKLNDLDKLLGFIQTINDPESLIQFLFRYIIYADIRKINPQIIELFLTKLKDLGKPLTSEELVELFRELSIKNQKYTKGILKKLIDVGLNPDDMKLIYFGSVRSQILQQVINQRTKKDLMEDELLKLFSVIISKYEVSRFNHCLKAGFIPPASIIEEMKRNKSFIIKLLISGNSYGIDLMEKYNFDILGICKSKEDVVRIDGSRQTLHY